ncbi:MAG: hypothetical protein LBJ84_07420, partial [Oscillospiraceae bacterium]|nr:hypothetical protein [Oscillospiraceae bacterium]
LPPEARRFCGGLSGLRNYGMMETAQLDTVTQSNFFKRYDSLKRDRELQEDMPPEIRGLVQQALQNKALPALPPAGGNPPALPEKPQPPAERKALGPPKPPPAPPPDAPKRAPYEPPDADEWERLREIQLEKLRAAGIKA